MKKYLILFLSICFFSCQQKENKNTSVEVSDTITKQENKEENSQITEPTLQQNEQKGDTILLNSKNEKGIFIAEGSLDSIHPRVYAKFKNESISELNAKIIPTTGKGNIRFNQIIFPDNSSDGPFGMDLKINIKQKGNYVLVIGHSQMADNPFWGKFQIQLENKTK